MLLSMLTIALDKIKHKSALPLRFCQLLKRAAGAMLCHNEAELKISMEIHHQMSSTDQAGKIRLAELIINDIYFL